MSPFSVVFSIINPRYRGVLSNNSIRVAVIQVMVTVAVMVKVAVAIITVMTTIAVAVITVMSKVAAAAVHTLLLLFCNVVSRVFHCSCSCHPATGDQRSVSLKQSAVTVAVVNTSNWDPGPRPLTQCKKDTC